MEALTNEELALAAIEGKVVQAVKAYRRRTRASVKDSWAQVEYGLAMLALRLNSGVRMREFVSRRADGRAG